MGLQQHVKTKFTSDKSKVFKCNQTTKFKSITFTKFMNFNTGAPSAAELSLQNALEHTVNG